MLKTLALTGCLGLALAAPWGISYDLNYTKIGVKLVVLLIIGILQFPSTASAVGDGGAASGYSATIGAGVWLTLLAGLAALAVGVVAFLQSRKGSSASATNGGQQWNGGYQQGQQQFGQETWVGQLFLLRHPDGFIEHAADRGEA
mgnify:CR=1 FL=1